MLNLEVKSAEVVTKSGTAKQSGKPYTIREQTAYVDLGGAYPEKIVLNLEDQAPYPVGRYILERSSVMVGQFFQLRFGRLSLKPASAVKAA